jgi:protein-tyrosine phosphatase
VSIAVAVRNAVTNGIRSRARTGYVRTSMIGTAQPKPDLGTASGVCVTVPGVVAELSLGLANAANARDLGGYPTADGRRVRRGLLYRANALNRLTEADVDAVGRLGLACLVDFRHETEIEFVGVNRLPAPPPGRLVALPLFDPDHDVFLTVGTLLNGTGDAARGRAALANTADTMIELYRWFVTAPSARETFTEALRLIASPGALPLLYHCTAGKDRTGWLSVLVLSALGVDREHVIADYLRTNDLNARGTAYILETVGDRLDDPTVLLPLLEARPEYLDAAFAEVDRRGGMDTYLRTGLGLDESVLTALREALTEEP